MYFRQPGFSVVHMDAGMLGKQVAAACLAPFPIAVRRLVIGADNVGAPGNFQHLELPQRKGIDWPG